MKNGKQERLLARSKERAYSCGDCYYIDSENDGYNFSGGSEWYQCKRYPPTALQSIDATDGDIYISFPNVGLKNWCGEFKKEPTICGGT